MKLSQVFSIKRFLKSLGFALNGIKLVVREEHNFLIHINMGIIVLILGFLLKIATWEWCTIVLVIGLVLTMEAFNTSIENLTDLVTSEYKPLAKKAKDTAAAAVLISSFVAVIIGLIIFAPKIWNIVI